VAICSSGLSEQVPWVREFNRLRRQYDGQRTHLSHGQAMERLPAAGLEAVGKVVDLVQLRATPELVFRHTLSYGMSRFAILADEANFKERLAAIIMPAMKDGAVVLPVISWEVMFERRRPADAGAGGFWDD
jgi:hypothetical protein